MRNVDLTDANAKNMDGKLNIESEELDKVIQDRKVSLSAEEEDNFHFRFEGEITV